MNKQASKVHLLMLITEMLDQNRLEDAEKLQRAFLGSIDHDERAGEYSPNITLDRKTKKFLKKNSLLTID